VLSIINVFRRALTYWAAFAGAAAAVPPIRRALAAAVVTILAVCVQVDAEATTYAQPVGWGCCRHQRCMGIGLCMGHANGHVNNSCSSQTAHQRVPGLSVLSVSGSSESAVAARVQRGEG